jgi:hypothetical protein
MVYKYSIPDFFDERPKDIRSLTPLVEDQYFLQRNYVYSQKLYIQKTKYVNILTQGPIYSLLQDKRIIKNTEFLAPNWSLEILIWFSNYENHDPIGRLKLGLIREKPIVETLYFGKKSLDLTTRDNLSIDRNNEKFLVDEGEYWVNFWYNGHNNGSYCSIKITEKP